MGDVLRFDAAMRQRHGWRSVHLASKRLEDARERERLANLITPASRRRLDERSTELLLDFDPPVA